MIKIILVVLLSQVKISLSSGYSVFWNDTLGEGWVLSMEMDKKIKNKINIGVRFKAYMMNENRVNFAVPAVYPLYFKNYLYILDWEINVSYGDLLWKIGPGISLSYIIGLYKAYNAIEIVYYDIKQLVSGISLSFDSGNLLKGNFGIKLEGEIGYLIRKGIYGNISIGVFYLTQ